MAASNRARGAAAHVPFHVTPPRRALPPGVWDCHVHVFGPTAAYPLADVRAYTPAEALPADLVRTMDTLGIGRFVLVQPSPYNDDHSRLLDALVETGERARGVAAASAAARRMEELRSWRALGVRGLRINQSSGGSARIGEAFGAAARSALALGWHIELHLDADVLALIEPLLRGTAIPIVLDHMGRIRAGTAHEREDLDRLKRLLDGGRTWIKLSAPYRLVEQGATLQDVGRIVADLVRANPERLVWGSDWPHTPPHPTEADLSGVVLPFRPVDSGELLDLIFERISDPTARARIQRENPRVLYD